MKKGFLRRVFYRRLLIALMLLAQLSFLFYLAFFQTVNSWIVAFILAIIDVFVIAHILLQKENSISKMPWLFITILLPLFGSLLYLLFSFQSSTKTFAKKVRLSEQRIKECTAKIDTSSSLAAATDACPNFSKLMNYLENFIHYPICNQTSAEYYSLGDYMVEPLLQEIRKAEKYIFVESYIIEEGFMWNEVLKLLEEKVANGVKVRVIYDDFGSLLTLPPDYAKKLRAKGIECVAFNTFRPFLSSIQNNRDHRKICSIDGKVAFIGGVNLADEYINKKVRFGHWKDAAIKFSGKAAWIYTLFFLQMWGLTTKENEDIWVYRPAFDEEETTQGFVQPYIDSPMDKENIAEQVYLQTITNARKYIYIMTPYLILDDYLLKALTLSAKSGVDVKIITPHIWDKRLVHLTTASYYKKLVESGVEIYEYTSGFVHSKVMVVDDIVATVGSVNFDYRSLYLNFECGSILYDIPAISDIKNDFIETFKVSEVITLEKCKCGFFKNIFQSLLRIFAPLM